MLEIEELAEDFDETSSLLGATNEEAIQSNTSNVKPNQATVLQDTTYNFDKTTVIIAIQILPATPETQRQVLLSAGIKGSPPIISSTTLAQLEQVEAVADILEKLKQSLPQIAEKALLRAENQRQKIQEPPKTKRVVSTPELPQPNSNSFQPSSQLSLF